MKHDEPELSALFQAQRMEDADAAPGFGRVLARRPLNGLGRLRLAVVSAVLVVVAAGIVVMRVSSSSKAAAEGDRGTHVGSGSTSAAEGGRGTQSSVVAVRDGGGTPPDQPAGGRRSDASATPAAILTAQSGGGTPPLQPAGRRRYVVAGGAKKLPKLSEWKSPTEALLKTPGGDLWTTVPTIGKFEIPKSSE